MALTKLNFGGNQQALVASNIPTLTANKLPDGTVLQVKSVNHKGAITADSTSYTLLTDLSLVITPNSTSSKILCMFTSYMYVDPYTRYGNMSLQRKIGSGSYSDISGTTILADNNRDGFLTVYDADSHVSERNGGWNFVDSPNSTSVITYTPTARRGSSSANFRIGNSNMITSFILMEIAG